MRLFGSIRELVSAVFRKDSQEITLKPSTSITYNAPVDVQLPAQSTNAVLVSRDSVDTLTNKKLSDSTTTIVDATDPTIGIVFNAAGSTSTQTTLLSSQTANRTLTLPDVTGTLISTGDTGTVTSAMIQNGTITNDDISNSAGILDTKLATISTGGKVANSATTATISATPDSIVLRDGSGNIAAAQVSGNISGNAVNVTGTVAIFNGGTGATTQQSALNSLAGGATANRVLRGDGSNITLSQVALGTDVSGTLPITSGGTGQTSANSALNALLPAQSAQTNKYLKTDGTNTSWASAAGGAGEINAVLNSSGADGTTGWTAGTNHSLTTLTGAGSPLSPITDSFFSFSSSAAIALGSQTSTSGVYDAITMPTGLRNRKLKVEFYYTTPASSAGTWAVAVYNGSTRVPLSTDSSGDTILPSSVTGGKFTAYFDTDSASAYSLNLVQRSRTGANDLYITNVIVGPGVQPQGAVVGEWTSYTPTLGGFGTATNVSCHYRRVGAALEVKAKWTNGTVTAANATISIPSNLTIDASINGAVFKTYGTWTRADSAAPAARQGVLFANTSASTTVLLFGYGDNGQSVNPLTIQTGSGISATGNEMHATFTVPIAEWAGSGTVQVAQNDVEYAYNTNTTTLLGAGESDTTSFGYGPGGVDFGSFNATTTGSESYTTRRVRFQTPIQIGDRIDVEVLFNGQWYPLAGNRWAVPYHRQSFAAYGVTVEPISGNNTDVEVRFGNAGRISGGTTYGSAGASWSSAGIKWRVRKASAGAAVGFGIVAPGTSAGLVSASGLPGNKTGNAIASGFVGEIKTAIVSSLSSQTQGVWRTGTGLSLEAGVWQINVIFGAGTVPPTQINFGIATAVNGAPVIDATGESTQRTLFIPGNTTDAVSGYGTGYFRTSSTSTFYPSGQAVKPNSTSYSYNFSISAIRIA